ncbi:DUF2065 domain-containing protein [Thauera humireducens]|uniref:DUF2065 domain-containing protein n=1 Tax=Thauera humireducens TaxID=1134435 RepID=UPI003C76FBD0
MPHGCFPVDCLRADADHRRHPSFCRASRLARNFLRLASMADGQIRFIGLTSMLAGVLLLFVLS